MSMHDEVDVIAVSSASERSTKPIRFRWHGRVYPVTSISSHSAIEERAILWHTFFVVSKNLSCILKLNTKTLQWFLDQMNDMDAGA